MCITDRAGEGLGDRADQSRWWGFRLVRDIANWGRQQGDLYPKGGQDVIGFGHLFDC